MNDGLDQVWNGFYDQRTQPLNERFDGRYRALVVETNDPLQMHRIRFKIPSMHDWSLNSNECPWAVPSPDMGGSRAGRWSHPCIGDIVWIDFEENHPYGPVWSGFADPTRRKNYAYPSLYGQTPIPVDEQSNVIGTPNDVAIEYTPRDGRPMSHGWADRYGNLDIHSSVGFFPAQHNLKPPPSDVDALTRAQFQQAATKPISNNPDSKFMARITKYGQLFIQSDVGYIWQQQNGSGEFSGDTASDESFEINRWQYWQKVLHENTPTGRDQRRLMMLTRYGHKLEMRDVGWVHSRNGEFGNSTVIANSSTDERWIKMRTKGGHLIEAIDIGCDEREDQFVSRLILDEVAAPTPLDQEDKFGADSRQIRLVTRSGRKIVVDDRGSHNTMAQNVNLPNSQIGLGVLIKGRATPGAGNNYHDASGNPRGYFWQFNESPSFNHTTWGTPLGQTIELNDNTESIIISTRLPSLPEACQFLGGNEFLTKTAISLSPESVSHHLLLDLQREVVRLKSRAGHGQAPQVVHSAPAVGQNAGLEIHDAPSNNAWTELIDIEHRGLWFSTSKKLGIWRASHGKDMYIWLDDGNNTVVVRNGNGKVQVYSSQNVEIIGHSVAIQASETCTISAPSGINFQVGGARYAFTSSALDMNVDERCRFHFAHYPLIQNGDGGPPGAPSGSGGASITNIKPVATPQAEPTNRL